MIDDFKLFPTLVRRINNFLSAEECSIIQKELLSRQDLLSRHELLTKGSTSSHEKTIQEKENIFDKLSIDLNDRIKQACSNYKKETGFYLKGIINSSWFNIQNKDSILAEHTHPNCILSGALYTYVDEGSSEIYFHNPNSFISYTYVEKHQEYSYDWYCFKPELGSLFLFPSWLKHGSNTTRNQTEGRTVISFNVL